MSIAVTLEVIVPEIDYDRFLTVLEKEGRLTAHVTDIRDIIVTTVCLRKEQGAGR